MQPCPPHGSDNPLSLVPLPTLRCPASLFDRLERRGLAQHAIDVAGLSVRVCDALDVDPVATSRVQRAALLHDVGKVAIPRAVLDAPRRLTDAEWLEVRAHPVIGEELVRAFPWLADVASLIRHHHERWDGAGYPDGLSGEEIPLGARIIAVCDAFDAMTSPRPYRAPVTRVQAVWRLREAAATQFDPLVAGALERVVLRPGRTG